MIRACGRLGGRAAAAQARASSLHHGQQIRCIGWCEFVEEKWDPVEKKYKHEDPEDAVNRIQEEVDSKRKSLTDRDKNQKWYRHIKPTTAKKDKANRIRYERKRDQVMDLINYIQFIKDHKNTDHW